MKSIIKFSVLALLATAFTVSCEKEIKAPEAASGEKVVRTFTLTFAQPDSKVAITDAGKTTWEAGDEILVHAGASGGDRVTVTLTADDIKANGKKAVITVEGLEPYDRADAGYKSTFYAIYPASAVPEGTLFYETRINKFDVPPMGAYDDGEGNFVFYNLCGVISFMVDGDMDSYEFIGNAGEVVAYYPDYQCRLALKTDGSVDYRRTSSNGADSTPSKVAKGSVVADGETVNYICIPQGVNLSSGFTIKFYEGEELTQTASTENALDLKCSSLLVLGDITDQLEDYVPPTSSDHKSEITGAESLADKQANCYVIRTPGAYKFPALKGNSSDAAGEVFDVELVWETYNNETEVVENSVIAAVDFEDNWVYFETPDELLPGNALIAAKDAQGKIIWSWHIWIPSTDIADVDADAICKATVMDRNLGALVVTATGENVVADIESSGLLYQWGRKDPFTSAKRWGSSSTALVAGTAFSNKDQHVETWVDDGDNTVTGNMTVAETIQNPTVYGNVSGGDWDETKDGTRWPRAGKSMYDPCPKGYAVMRRESSSVLWNTTNIATAAKDAGLTWESSLEGHWFSIADASGNKLTFPLAGYIDDCVVSSKPYLEYPGKRAAVYAAYLNSDGNPYHLNIREEKTDYHKAASTSGARGASVRCVTIAE